MTNYYYKKRDLKLLRLFLRTISAGLIAGGITLLFYVLAPLISWQLYFAPLFAQGLVEAPIPKITVLSTPTIQSLLSNGFSALRSLNYSDAQNWFPNLPAKHGQSLLPAYSISIPKLNIQKATVSTTDYDLDNHLVQYAGTELPGNVGNPVIFGHSTLPQLFNAKDYKTIFANLYKLQVGDIINAHLPGISYTYKIFAITVTDPFDTSIFTQSYTDRYLTIVTCTPPGTTWKRLILQARLSTI
jgi:sortase A